MGLNPSQIEAIDAASPEFKEVLISSYRESMQAEIEATRAMTLLTDKDQRDGIDIVKRGLWVLVAIVLLLVGVAGIAVLNGEPVVAAAALAPIGLAAIGGVVTVALRGRDSRAE